MPIPTLKPGCLAYLDSITSGLVPCKVIYIETVDGYRYATITITATRRAYDKGQTVDRMLVSLVVPRDAVTRFRAMSGPRILPYTVSAEA